MTNDKLTGVWRIDEWKRKLNIKRSYESVIGNDWMVQDAECREQRKMMQSFSCNAQRVTASNAPTIESPCYKIQMHYPYMAWIYKDGKYKVDMIYRTLFLNKSSAHREVNTSYLEFSIKVIV